MNKPNLNCCQLLLSHTLTYYKAMRVFKNYLPLNPYGLGPDCECNQWHRPIPQATCASELFHDLHLYYLLVTNCAELTLDTTKGE